MKPDADPSRADSGAPQPGTCVVRTHDVAGRLRAWSVGSFKPKSCGLGLNQSVLKLFLLVSVALIGCKKEASQTAPIDLAAIESITWSSPDPDRDNRVNWLQADVLLRLPAGAQCADLGTVLEQSEQGQYLVTGSRIDRVAHPGEVNSAMLPGCTADANGRCLVQLGFSADSIASHATSGTWTARLKLVWRLPKDGGSYAFGNLDSLVQVPPQRVELYRVGP